jgi:hypothetical protein
MVRMFRALQILKRCRMLMLPPEPARHRLRGFVSRPARTFGAESVACVRALSARDPSIVAFGRRNAISDGADRNLLHDLQSGSSRTPRTAFTTTDWLVKSGTAFTDHHQSG